MTEILHSQDKNAPACPAPADVPAPLREELARLLKLGANIKPVYHSEKGDVYEIQSYNVEGSDGKTLDVHVKPGADMHDQKALTYLTVLGSNYLHHEAYVDGKRTSAGFGLGFTGKFADRHTHKELSIEANFDPQTEKLVSERGWILDSHLNVRKYFTAKFADGSLTDYRTAPATSFTVQTRLKPAKCFDVVELPNTQK